VVGWGGRFEIKEASSGSKIGCMSSEACEVNQFVVNIKRSWERMKDFYSPKEVFVIKSGRRAGYQRDILRGPNSSGLPSILNNPICRSLAVVR
jgi:hypothetical protein